MMEGANRSWENRYDEGSYAKGSFETLRVHQKKNQDFLLNIHLNCHIMMQSLSFSSII